MSLEQDASTLKAFVEAQMEECYRERTMAFDLDDQFAYLAFETRLYAYKRVCDIMGWSYPAEWNL